jgi:tripartite-type tricarboxylate transporter receptor subunit TctC
MTFVSMGPHIQFVQSGAIRVLGVALPKRVPYLQDVPTFAEQGFAGFEATTWFALFAPRGTPKEIINQLNSYARALYDDAASKGRLEANFVDPMIMDAEAFGALVKADAARWEKIVKEAGVKLD